MVVAASQKVTLISSTHNLPLSSLMVKVLNELFSVVENK